MSRKRNTGTSQGRSEQDVLNLFMEKYQDLAMTSLSQTGIGVGHHIMYNQEGITTVLSQPDEDAIRSFLLTFRQFVSENEPLFLGRVYSVCYQCLGDEMLKDQISQMRKRWASVQRGKGMNIVLYEVEFSGVKIFDLWANGWYFHSDTEYRRILERVPPVVWDMLRAQFIGFIIEVMPLVRDLCQVILGGFDENPARPGFILLPST
jgi:hypothetical protein